MISSTNKVYYAVVVLSFPIEDMVHIILGTVYFKYSSHYIRRGWIRDETVFFFILQQIRGRKNKDHKYWMVLKIALKICLQKRISLVNKWLLSSSRFENIKEW